MKVRARYGDGWVEATSPSGVDWMPPPTRVPFDAEPDEDAAVEDLLLHPTTGAGLDARLAGARRIAIVIPDRTRPAGLDHLLPALFRFLLDAGGPARFRVTLLAGGGTHAPDPLGRLRSLVPEAWAGSLSCAAHDATNDDELEMIAETAAGTPVVVNRRFQEQDVAIAVGAIGFHYFAGFSGGRKAIFPGLASYEGIRLNHRLVLHETEGHGLNPACRPGNLDGNPVHMDMLDAVGRLSVPVFVLNAYLSPDHRIDGLVAGDLGEAHEVGCRRYLARHRVRIPAPADLVVADAGGSPKDIDLVQAHKALVHLSPAVRDGGVAILAARCAEGVGSKTMLQWFAHPDSVSIESALRSAYSLNSHTALSFRRHTERFRLLLVSELDPSVLEGTGAEPLGSLGSALDRARHLLSGEVRAVRLSSPVSDILEVGDALDEPSGGPSLDT